MSDIRAYLMTIDSNKTGAEEIAHETSRSRYAPYDLIKAGYLNYMARARITPDKFNRSRSVSR